MIKSVLIGLSIIIISILILAFFIGFVVESYVIKLFVRDNDLI